MSQKYGTPDELLLYVDCEQQTRLHRGFRMSLESIAHRRASKGHCNSFGRKARGDRHCLGPMIFEILGLSV